ncbi:MAG TPA: tetratricopeptide repeat protein [Candidatus Deferrimicrobium sp.]|nr:tetratricopeptide repeat protein [Candidatus Deferrimicrobium sp.]
MPVFLALLLEARQHRNEADYFARNHDLKYAVAAGLICIALTASFVYLRAKTHFFGDGYQLLSHLSAGNPQIEKHRQYGESLAHIWLYSAIGGNNEQDALLTYQIISILAGVVFLVSVAFFSKALFQRSADRLLFLFGIVSGGYMLLYFGYVENYSIFILSFVVYCLAGLLVWKGKAGKWVLLTLQALAVFFHIFGVTLIPATIYLLMRDTKIHNGWSRLGRNMRFLIVVASAGLGLSVFLYAYTTDYFFRFALIPLFRHRFTQEGYTLFSAKHFADYGNLLILLLPALPIFIALVVKLPLRQVFTRPVYQWLGIAVLSTLGAAFIFDPKLGMPRDWDLFSFCGVPLTILCYYMIVDHRETIRGCAAIGALAIALGFLVLIPRAVASTIPEVAIARFRSYLYLDKVKNQNAWIFLTNYYEKAGDSAKSRQTFVEWKSNFPEERLIARANELYYKEKNIDQTVRLLYRILDLNPTYSAVYSFLGFCYLDLQQYDSAVTLLRLADALSPNRPNNLNNLGMAYYNTGKYEKAEQLFLKAAHLDSTGYSSQYNLAQFYQRRNQPAKYSQCLQLAASRADAPAAIRKELIEYYLTRGEFQAASAAVDKFEQLSADTAFIAALRKRYPLWDSLSR